MLIIARAHLPTAFEPKQMWGWFSFGKEAYSDFQLAQFPQFAELLVKQLERSVEAARNDLHASLATAIAKRLWLDWDCYPAKWQMLNADMVPIISRSVDNAIEAALTLPPGFVLQDAEDCRAMRPSTVAELTPAGSPGVPHLPARGAGAGSSAAVSSVQHHSSHCGSQTCQAPQQELSPGQL